MQGENVGTVTCPSCGAMLVAGLRFCRMCGYRLGEGVEEYIPTQRFDPAAPPVGVAPAPGTDPFAPRQTWGVGPMQPVQPMQPLGAVSPANDSTFGLANACARKSGNWWLWIIIAVVILTAAGVVPFAVRGPRGGSGAAVVAPRSFLGVDGLESADGGAGALIVGIAAPETPVVRAGLIGGDIITSFDGKPVRDAEGMRKLLGETPVGKTVEVAYVRDGVAGKTMLTTIAEKDSPGLKLFDRRPGGRGDIGLNRRDLDRVSVPGMNIFGVELGDINRNGPADLAGLREGDIVIEFNGNPIRTEGDLRYRIFEAVPGSTATAILIRGGERVEIPVKVGRSKD